MTLPPGNHNRDLEQACLLLQEYSFELGGFNPQALTQIWQQRLEVDATWIRAAVLEALYLGRYKAFSVEQILQMWKRRQQPVRHFNPDFERVVFGPLAPHFHQAFVAAPVGPEPIAAATQAAVEPETMPTAAAELPYFNRPELPPSVESTEPSTTATTTSEPSKPPTAATPIRAIAPDIEPTDETFPTPEPIQKFVPVQQPSGFYSRLQAVARIAP